MNDERTQWLQRQPQTELAKKLGIFAWIFSAILSGSLVLPNFTSAGLKGGMWS